jgi:dTDP-4-amino-4,6-dideoxygalactose transaminase
MREHFLPVALPWVDEKETTEILDTISSGWLTTGPKTKRFEEEFAQYVGSKFAVAVNSCTAALHIALASIGISSDDEVIISDLTFACNANIVIQLGGRPVLVDVSRDTQLIDVTQIESRITSRTKAIMPVHFAGYPAQMDEIHEIAKKYGIPVIEDAAHASGTFYKGKIIGSLPGTLATAFSFYAIKNMTTGEGGMLTTNDPDIAEKARKYSLHGMSKDAWKRYSSAGSWYYEIVLPGYKYNMTDIQASFGIHQLRKLKGFNERRREICNRYDQAFIQLPQVTVPIDSQFHYHSRHLYPLRLDIDSLSIDRGKFIEELKNRNIGSTVHYVPIHMHPYYRDLYKYSSEDYPNAKWIFERTVTLPLFPKMTDKDVDDVINAVKEIVEINKS